MTDNQPENNHPDPEYPAHAGVTRFDKQHVLYGVVAGVIITLGTPISVGYATQLAGAMPPWLTPTLMIIGVSGGVLIALTAAFFGTVIPTETIGKSGRHRWRH